MPSPPLSSGVHVDGDDDLVFLHHSCGERWLNHSLHDALLAKDYIDELKEEYSGARGNSHPNNTANADSTQVFASNPDNFIDNTGNAFISGVSGGEQLSLALVMRNSL